MGILILIFSSGLLNAKSGYEFLEKEGNIRLIDTLRIELKDAQVNPAFERTRKERVWSPELLQNDDDKLYWFPWMKDQYFAARFQPPYDCMLEDLIVYFVCPTDSTSVSQACSLFVWNNSGSNTPGDKVLWGALNLPAGWLPPGSYTLLKLDLSNFHLSFTSDFWIGFKKMSNRPPFLMADNTSSPSNRNMYKDSPPDSWVSWTSGDFAFRAEITRAHPTYWPISGDTTMDTLTSAFGPRNMDDEPAFDYDFHRGVDIKADDDTVYAVESGEVVYSRPSDESPGGFGDLIIIKHNYNDLYWYYSLYAHLDQRLFEDTEKVNKGEQIAISGSSGGDYPPHLHFGILEELDLSNQIENNAIHPLYILPHTNQPENYRIEDLSLDYPEVTFTLRVPGNILDCRTLDCQVWDLFDEFMTDWIVADYEYIASLGVPTIDDPLQDTDDDSEDDIEFRPHSFYSSHSHQVVDGTFYLENSLPSHWAIYVTAYDDNLSPQEDAYLDYTGSGIEDKEGKSLIVENQQSVFYGSVNIKYQVFVEDEVKIKIYDSSGKVVKELINGTKSPGKYEVRWNGTNDNDERLPAGVYFPMIENENHKETIKLIMIK